MKYLIALICPPLAVLLCGKVFQSLLSIVLCLCFWFPGVIHALFVVSSHNADKRNKELMGVIMTKDKEWC